MREIYSEEKALLFQVRNFFLDNQHPEETALVVERARHIEALLKKIMPWRKLKLGAYAKRIMLAFGIYLLLMVPVGMYVYGEYFNEASLLVSTEGVGESVMTQYVPITTIDVMAGGMVQRKTVSSAIEIEKNIGQGLDAGMAVKMLQGTENYTVVALWTAPREGKRVLLKQVQDARLHLKGDPVILMEEYDLTAASAYRRKDGYFVIVGSMESPVKQIVLQLFSPEWKVVGQRVIIPAKFKDEYVGAIQASEWGDRTAVITNIVPPEDATILEKHQPFLRVFEADFTLAYEAPIQVGGLHTDLFAKFITRSESNRFYIITSGHPILDESNGQRGFELYALEFTNEGTPVEYFKLTNNGRPHDFWPSDAWFDTASGYTYITNHRTPSPNFSSPDYSVTHPPQTATGYVHVLDSDLNMLGTVIIDEGGGYAGIKFGITRTRIYKKDNRLYVLYDVIQKDSETGEETRLLKMRYLDLNI